METKKIVKIRKDRKCECCGKLHKNGTTMLFGEWKDPKLDDDEKQIGIQYHRYYWSYDELKSTIVTEEHGTILIPVCA